MFWFLPQDLKWNGLGAGDLFQRPKASVVISVTNLQSGKLSFSHAVATYQTVEVC